jgi:hypothetical protein
MRWRFPDLSPRAAKPTDAAWRVVSWRACLFLADQAPPAIMPPTVIMQCNLYCSCHVHSTLCLLALEIDLEHVQLQYVTASSPAASTGVIAVDISLASRVFNVMFFGKSASLARYQGRGRAMEAVPRRHGASSNAAGGARSAARAAAPGQAVLAASPAFPGIASLLNVTELCTDCHIPHTIPTSTASNRPQIAPFSRSAGYSVCPGLVEPLLDTRSVQQQ